MIEELDNSGETTLSEGRGAPASVVEPQDYSLDGPVPAVVTTALPVRLWRWLRTGRVPAVVALTTAVLTGTAATAATHGWDRYQRHRVEEATVSLIGSIDDGLTGGGDAEGLSLDGAILLTNIGPAPVRIDDLRGTQSGVTVSLLPGPADVLPGRSTDVNVHLTLKCYAAILQEPLPLTLSVRAADGHRQAASVAVDARAWADLCHPVSTGE